MPKINALKKFIKLFMKKKLNHILKEQLIIMLAWWPGNLANEK